MAFRLDEARLPRPIRFSVVDLDTHVDPCVDFAGFANGKWLAANPMPADRSRWGPMLALDERSLEVRHQIADRVAGLPDPRGIEKIIGDLWSTGMDAARIEAQGLAPLASRLAEIEALTDPDSIAAYLRTTAARGESTLVHFGPRADLDPSGIHIGQASQAGLGLPERGYYLDADKRDKLRAYAQHVATVLTLSGVPPLAAVARAEAVIAFETRLAKASRSRRELARDTSLPDAPMSPADADLVMPRFSWTKFFKVLGIEAPTRLALAIPAYHRELDAMIADVPIETWRAYLRFHLVDGASPYLGERFVEEHHAFYDVVMERTKELPARWKRVLGAIEGVAGEAMGRLYVDVAFLPQSKARIEDLVRRLDIAVVERIEKLTWMSEATKQKALARAAAFTAKIGYPERWRDYAGLETTRDSFLENVFVVNAFDYRWQIGKIGQPVDRREWSTTPQTVDAYFRGVTNDVVFPAAILQPPYFDPTADDPLVYGAIGAMLGHEMAHGYDDQGRRFGPTGGLLPGEVPPPEADWWTPADATRFAERTRRLVQQFDAFEAMPGVHVDGTLTLGENIADLAGLATAYDAMTAATDGSADPMIDGLSRDQRFFLAWATIWREQVTPEKLKVMLAADPHAPGRFRAIAAPSNLPAFAAAFGCKPGQPMMRTGATRVAIW